MQVTINGRTYDYNTIAQFIERKMNGASVHDLRVELATIRSVMTMINQHGQTDDREKRLLDCLSFVNYK